MTHQRAVTVVAAPLEDVEHAVRDVGSWPAFLLGLEQVTETSFGRYTFMIFDHGKAGDAGAVREVPVAVADHPGEHRIAWHALEGPRFDGEIRLSPVDARHTRVSLAMTADPAGFLASLAELVKVEHTSTAMLDLHRLEALVAGATPRP